MSVLSRVDFVELDMRKSLDDVIDLGTNFGVGR